MILDKLRITFLFCLSFQIEITVLDEAKIMCNLLEAVIKFFNCCSLLNSFLNNLNELFITKQHLFK